MKKNKVEIQVELYVLGFHAYGKVYFVNATNDKEIAEKWVNRDEDKKFIFFARCFFPSDGYYWGGPDV